MISFLPIEIESDRIEEGKLSGVPPVKILRKSADEIAADEDVEDAANEGNLLSHSHRLGAVPSCAESIDRGTHALAILLKLFIMARDSASPFIDYLSSCLLRSLFQLLLLTIHLFSMCSKGGLEFFETLGKSEILNEIKDTESVKGWECIDFVSVI